MDSASGSGDVSGGQAGRGTPFRERALEERRLKEELMRSATPGLKRRRGIGGRVREDPVELKSYLRDLSAVLALQDRRNLTSVLMEAREVEAREVEGDRRELRSGSEGPVSGLKDSVFSLLEHRTRPKIRRVQTPIAIQDADVLEAPEAPAEGVSDPPSSVEALEPENSVSAIDSHSEEVYKEPGAALVDNFSEVSESDDSEPDEPEPLMVSRLRRCLSLYMEREGMRLGKGGWRALQTASEALLKGMAQEMSDGEGGIVPDRQSILRAFVKFEVLAPNSSNEALFEICCKYLTLEDLNKLEAALFT